MPIESTTFNSFYSRLLKIKRSFESVRLVFEYGDTDSAALIGRHTIATLIAFVDDLKNESEQNKNYVEMVIKNKLPTFDEDRQKYSNPMGTTELNEASLNDFSNRLEKYLNVLERELKIMYQSDYSITKTLVKYLKPFLVFAGALLVVYFSFSLVQWFRFRHQGLLGEYYNDKNLTKFSRSRVDQQINFKWGGISPLRGVRKESFSVRWTGFLKAPESGPYEFITHSDDGIRLWIDDKLLIDNWTIHRLMMDNATMDLTAGSHAVKIEYFQAKANSIVRLFWKYGTMGQPQIIPPKFLVPDEKYATR